MPIRPPRNAMAATAPSLGHTRAPTVTPKNGAIAAVLPLVVLVVPTPRPAPPGC